MSRGFPHVGQRHLMGSERSLHRQAIDDLRPGPPFEAAQPRSAGQVGAFSVKPVRRARLGLDGSDFRVACVQRRGERLVHRQRVVSLDPMDLITVAFEELLDILIAVPAQHGGAGDLVAVQVQDGQHGAVADRVEELDTFPGAFERTRLRLAVPDDGDGDEVRVIEDSAEGMHEDVAEFASLVNGTGGRDADVARDAARRRELAEERRRPAVSC